MYGNLIGLFMLGLCAAIVAAHGECLSASASPLNAPPSVVQQALSALGTSACGVAAPTSAGDPHYVETFERVWQIVNDTYFDPGFGGLDWLEVRRRYRPRIAAASNDTEFYGVLNSMLFELGVSHALAGPAKEILEAGSAYMFAEGTIGLDIRIVEGRAVATSVAPDSAAAKAGLRTGLIIERIDGEGVASIIENTKQRPPYNEQHRRFLATEELLRRIYGKVGTSVTLTWTNRQGRSCTMSVRRAERKGGRRLAAGFPPVFLECERRKLEDGVGYVRFNAFQPDVPQEVLDSISSFGNAHGMIVDLRGNNGGATEAIRRVAARLLSEPVSNCVFKGRNETNDLVLEPARAAYAGPLVVLVDDMSISSAEVFSAVLQRAGRAVVIGERTPGVATSASMRTLPHDVVLAYPVSQIVMEDGTILEGHGVIPDIEVCHERRALLDGRDLQVEAAIEYLRTQSGGKE